VALSKSAKLRTDKRNILSKLRTPNLELVINCTVENKTANCQLSRQKAVCGVSLGFVLQARTVPMMILPTATAGFSTIKFAFYPRTRDAISRGFRRHSRRYFLCKFMVCMSIVIFITVCIGWRAAGGQCDDVIDDV